MRNPFAAGVGGVLSADIAVPQHERERSFYSHVLTTGSDPLWRDDLTNNRGTPVIGLGERTPEYEKLPLQWMPHVQVFDVGASVAQATKLGGTMLMHGRDEAGRSQWAVLEDPEGAAFGIIPVVDQDIYASHLGEGVGCICWLTLVVSDLSLACEFYTRVVGWSTVSVDGGVELQRPGGDFAAAIVEARGKYQGIPPLWIISLLVDNLGQSIRNVVEGRGEIIIGSSESGHAVLKDPVGVYIGLQDRNQWPAA